MESRFAIQASRPRTTAERDSGDETLSDAIQTVFPLETEFALMIWNWVYIPIHYKYDVSIMTDDIVDLVDAILASPTGHQTIQWASSTFAATWKVDWTPETTTVHAEWDTVLGDVEAALRAKPAIQVATSDFVAEWRELLDVVAEALAASGYDDLEGLQRLKGVAARVRSRGILYRD
jgi:hypothetical protein